MTSIKYPSGVSNYFHYDSMLRRYAMEDSDGLRYFSWDYSGLKLLTERDEQGEVTALYSHGYSAIPGIGSVATAQKFESDTTYYQFPVYDNRGSVYRLTNDDGDVVFSAEYNAFGEVLDESNTGATNRLGYQSQWLTLKDSGNELVLSPARVYSAKLGRFLQKDMLFQMTLLGQQGSYWNSMFRDNEQYSILDIDNYGLYNAFNNNPLVYNDPMGKSWWGKLVKFVKNLFTLGNKRNKIKKKILKIREFQKKQLEIFKEKYKRLLEIQNEIKELESKSCLSAKEKERLQDFKEKYDQLIQSMQALEVKLNQYKKEIGNLIKQNGGIQGLGKVLGATILGNTIQTWNDPSASFLDVTGSFIWDVGSGLDPIGATDIIEYITNE